MDGVPKVGSLGLRPRAEPSLLYRYRFGEVAGLIDVMADLSATGSAVTLTIAGTDSRHNPGYLARLQMRCRDMRNITFRGYVPESDVPSLFRASACVLPYATMTGTSGVAV